MINYKTILLLTIVVLMAVSLIVSCKITEEDRLNKDIRKILAPYRIGLGHIFKNNNEKLAYELYRAVYREDLKKIKKILKKGADPNYCLGEGGWVDSNPLNIVARSFYNVYYHKRIEKIPDLIPDLAVLNILLEAGADINQRPYVWSRVFTFNNSFLKDNNTQEYLDSFTKDANRLIEAFLKAGADPDKLGNPYPFSYEAVKARITDKQANEYFAHGTRAINIAIEKGIIWESQVDLLLQYTTLDEESLEAAERSNDPAMVEKINRLWEKQQKALITK